MYQYVLCFAAPSVFQYIWLSIALSMCQYMYLVVYCSTKYVPVHLAVYYSAKHACLCVTDDGDMGDVWATIESSLAIGMRQSGNRHGGHSKQRSGSSNAVVRTRRSPLLVAVKQPKVTGITHVQHELTCTLTFWWKILVTFHRRMYSETNTHKIICTPVLMFKFWLKRCA